MTTDQPAAQPADQFAAHAPDSTDTHARVVLAAERFHALHHDGVLVLPNAWDAASARIVQDAGASAVATTSAGVAWSLGVPDGGGLDRDLALGALARVVAAVDVPVTADLEAGYGASLDELAETIRAVLATGVVGINLEDAVAGTMIDAAAQADRIALVRSVADHAGVALFVNARTDGYLLGVDDVLASTLARAETYAVAGADGVFVPGVVDLATIRTLADAVPVPLNVMAWHGAPSVAELAEAGARRVSVGMAVAQAAYGLAARASTELLTTGTYESLAGGIGYGELNDALAATRA